MAGGAPSRDDQYMTTPPPTNPPPVPPAAESSTASAPPPAPDALSRLFTELRRIPMRRDTRDKWLAGTCSGLARRLGVDPLVIRAITIALLIMGIGFVAYLIAWLIIPQQDDEIVLERALRDGDGWGIALIVVLALSLFSWPNVVGNWSGWWVLMSVVLSVGIVWFVIDRSRGPRGPQPPPPGPYAGYPAGSDTPIAAYPPPPAGGHTTAPDTGATPPWTTAPTQWLSGGWTPPPARPIAPPPPPRPRRRGVGAGGGLLAVGMAIVIFGLGLVLAPYVGFASDGVEFGLILATIVTGLVVIGIGLTGRRSGFVGFVTSCTALLTALALVLPIGSLSGGVGERTWTPAATSEPVTYQLGAGRATLDLRHLPTDGAETKHVTVDLGAAGLTVLFADRASVSVNARFGVGQLHESSMEPSTDVRHDVFGGQFSGHWGDDNVDDIVLDVRVGVGEVHLIRGEE